MKFNKITTIAMTRRIWINPPKVVEVTKPRSHKTMRIIAIVHNIFHHPSFIKVVQVFFTPYSFDCVTPIKSQNKITKTDLIWSVTPLAQYEG
jgi:hypothetical protein